MKILLMGNPNVGKSVFFSRLTGTRVIASNYPGTTVEFTKGFMELGGERVEVIDVPGTYSLEPTSRAEEVAMEMLSQGDVIINVVDATNLERNLYLTFELMEKKISMVVALNMWDETRHKGIEIDIEKLETFLQLPTVTTCAVTGRGIKEVVSRIKEAKSPEIHPHSRDERWADIGKVVEDVQRISHHHHTLLERFEDVSTQPLSGAIIGAIVVYSTFKLVRFLGEGLIRYLLDPFFNNIWQPLIMKLSLLLSREGFLHHILIGNLIEKEIDFVQSFGLLTTGLYVPLGMVLPYVFSFYLALSLLEDIGYLPRLAVLLDAFMHRIGLHGYAIIPNFLGLGCNVPGILATRILESRRERFIAATIISIGVPCAALQAMIFGLVGAKGGGYVAIVYGTLLIVWLVLGFILNKTLKGFGPELLMEIPPYRFPSCLALLKKLRIRIVSFLRDALPIVLLGILLVNILYALKVFDFIANLFSPIVTRLLGLPKEAVAALIIGFLRKDIAVGMFAPLNLSAKQLVVGCTVLAMSFPCIATFTVLFKELGLKDLVKATVIMLFVAILVGTLLNLLL